MHSQAVGMQKFYNFALLLGPTNYHFQPGDEGVLPPTIPGNPYVGQNVQKRATFCKSSHCSTFYKTLFLGGLSLHLNHLIA